MQGHIYIYIYIYIYISVTLVTFAAYPNKQSHGEQSVGTHSLTQSSNVSISSSAVLLQVPGGVPPHLPTGGVRFRATCIINTTNGYFFVFFTRSALTGLVESFEASCQWALLSVQITRLVTLPYC